MIFVIISCHRVCGKATEVAKNELLRFCTEGGAKQHLSMHRALSGIGPMQHKTCHVCMEAMAPAIADDLGLDYPEDSKRRPAASNMSSCMIQGRFRPLSQGPVDRRVSNAVEFKNDYVLGFIICEIFTVTTYRIGSAGEYLP